MLSDTLEISNILGKLEHVLLRDVEECQFVENN
jgi:hypothetical protein